MPEEGCRASGLSGRCKRPYQASAPKEYSEAPAARPDQRLDECVEQKDREILELRAQVATMQKVIDEFETVPQTFVTMHPGAQYGISYELSSIFEKLTRAGVSESCVVELLEVAQSALPAKQLSNRALVDAWAVKYILDNIQISTDRVSPRFHTFVGADGQGKTTTLVKMAAHLVVVEKRKIAIVTTDTHKVGASEQLKIYAQILNVPFVEVNHPVDWNKIDQALHTVDHILVDTPGSSLKKMSEVDELQFLLPPELGGRAIHYVQSVFAKDEDAEAVLERYRQIPLTDLVFTHLDESRHHGLIYNLHRMSGLPLHSFGIGRDLPEDFEAATKERVVDLLFKLTKVGLRSNGGDK